MPRVIGIDPGHRHASISAASTRAASFSTSQLPTGDALRDPAAFIARLTAHGPVDLIAGPSGYGLPCVSGHELTDIDLRLAFLAADGESGGIGGLRALVRALVRSQSAGRVYTRRHSPHVGARPPQGQPRGHGHRRQSVRRCARCSRAVRAARMCAERDGVRLTGAWRCVYRGHGRRRGAHCRRHRRILRTAWATRRRRARWRSGLSRRPDCEVDDFRRRGFCRCAATPTSRRLLHSTSPQHRMAWDAYVEGAIKAVLALVRLDA